MPPVIISPTCIRPAPIDAMDWLPRLDSHQDRRGQNPSCCCYTTMQGIGGAGGSCNLTMSGQKPGAGLLWLRLLEWVPTAGLAPRRCASFVPRLGVGRCGDMAGMKGLAPQGCQILSLEPLLFGLNHIPLNWCIRQDSHLQTLRSKRRMIIVSPRMREWWVATVLPRALRFKRPLHHCNACNP